MGSAKMCGLLTASFLLLTLLGYTEACSCAPRHPQTAYCTADMVIKGKFMSVSKKPLNISMGEPMWTLVYEFKTNKIYKAPKGMQDVRFLHTPAMESLCGYEHKAPMNGEDYVVAGMLEGDDVMITSCSFIQPWAQLSPAQRRGLSLTYRKGCNCTIMPCTSVPFEISSNSQCLWTDGLESRIWDGPQAKRMACLPRLNTTDACSWKVLVTQGPGNLRRSLLKQ